MGLDFFCLYARKEMSFALNKITLYNLCQSKVSNRILILPGSFDLSFYFSKCIFYFPKYQSTSTKIITNITTCFSKEVRKKRSLHNCILNDHINYTDTENKLQESLHHFNINKYRIKF